MVNLDLNCGRMYKECSKQTLSISQLKVKRIPFVNIWRTNYYEIYFIIDYFDFTH